MISLFSSFLVMRIRLWPCEVIVLFLLYRKLCAPLSRDGRRFVFWALSHELSLFLTQQPTLLSPSVATLSKREAPGQFPLPSFAACHVVYSAQLFKKCWISTMAFTGALSTFVWSNLGWMRWVPEQGELSCSVHYHASDWPAPSLFIFLCCTWNCHGGVPLWMAAVGVWARLGVCGCHCYLPVLGRVLGPADSQLLKVCLTEGLGSNSSTGTSQSLVSVLNFLARVGGG